VTHPVSDPATKASSRDEPLFTSATWSWSTGSLFGTWTASSCRSLDRREDVKKILSLEIPGAWFNEMREIPVTIVNRTAERVGRYARRAGRRDRCPPPAVTSSVPTWHNVALAAAKHVVTGARSRRYLRGRGSWTSPRAVSLSADRRAARPAADSRSGAPGVSASVGHTRIGSGLREWPNKTASARFRVFTAGAAARALAPGARPALSAGYRGPHLSAAGSRWLW
jgi:hypothetical protein